MFLQCVTVESYGFDKLTLFQCKGKEGAGIRNSKVLTFANILRNAERQRNVNSVFLCWKRQREAELL